MGLIDYFNSKKEEKQRKEGLKTKYLHIASKMKCNINAMSPIDWLAVQSFVFATNNRESRYINGNRICTIDTTIYTCFVLLTICETNINNKISSNKFSSEFLNKYKLALADYFYYSQSYSSDLIENRFKLYNNAIKHNYDLNDVNCEFKQVLLNDESYNEMRFYDENSPLMLAGLDNDILCQMEISAYFSSLMTICKDLISSVVEYYNIPY